MSDEKIIIEYSYDRFVHFFYFLGKHEPDRIISVSSYTIDHIFALEEVVLVPAENSTSVIRFGDREVTIQSCTRAATQYATEATKQIYIKCMKDELTVYTKIFQEISYYFGKANPDQNEILLRESTIKDSVSIIVTPVKVLPLDKLGITTGVAQQCIRYIYSCMMSQSDGQRKLKGNKCNILLYGPYGTGKLSLVKALALCFNRPLSVFTVRSDMPIHLIRDNTPPNSILCLREAEAAGPLCVEYLESYQFQQKNIIVIMIAHDPKAMTVSLFSAGRIGHIAKLEPLKKQEMKLYIEKMCPHISEETLKSCMNHFLNLASASGGGVDIATISNYLQRYSDASGSGTKLLFPDYIDQFTEQCKIRKEILHLHIDKMYT
jgi:hypothetical protein